MRIIVDGTPFFRKMDGVGRYSTGIIEALSQQHPEWDIFILGFIDDKQKHSSISGTTGVKYIYLPFPRRLYQGVYSRFVRIPIDIFLPPFDIFLCFNFTIYPFVTKGKKAVAIHDTAYIDLPDTIEKKNLRFLKKHVPLSIRDSDLVVGTSHFTMKRLLETFGDNFSHCVAQNATDSSFDSLNSSALRDGSIVAVGTLEPRKNISILLEAYNGFDTSFQKQHPLYIIGKEGWGDTSTPALPQSVHFTGYVSDDELRHYYSKASLFVYPSKYEGFGLPLLEAMLAKVPLLASDIPPFNDIGQDTINYFNPNSSDELKSKIDNALKSPPDTSTAYTRATLYTWDNSAAALSISLDELVE